MRYWTTLAHNGVLFPPLYTRLPADVKAYYDGVPLELNEEQEEALCLYAKAHQSLDAVGRRNFFKDWKRIRKTNVTDFSKVDVSRIVEYLGMQPRIPIATPEALEKYKTATVDGEPQPVANFIVEPPGLFKGRGDHPLRGKLKKRIWPKDVTINLSRGAPVPVPNVPGKWGKVVHDKSAMWIASWRQNVTQKVHYIYLGQDSSVRMNKDREKFELARKLKRRIEKVRAAILKGMMDKDSVKRQICVALWMIDMLAIRVGNEKSADEAQTVGVTSLLVEHITLSPGKMRLNFLGKDSIRYAKTVEVPEQVWRCIASFVQDKKEQDEVFELIDAKMVNDYLQELMPGLTAKVFRTMNSSMKFQELLDSAIKKITKGGSQKIVSAAYLEYVMANIKVAELCNHQKMSSPSKTKKKKPLNRLAAAKKNLNLSTSRQNYIDPRITVAFAKRLGIPIEKFFSKRLLQKFKWAVENTEEDFHF